MKTLDEKSDPGLKRALDLPPEVAARVVRKALAAPGASRPPVLPRHRWLPLATALVLSLAVTCYLARGPVRPAPRRASITNVGDVVIATTPDGEGRLLRSEGAQPEPSGITLIIRHGGTL